jgi:uncharacterized protein with GYD domain
MASYLLQVSFKPESLAAMIKKPADRREIVSKLTVQIGGKLVGYWFAFGEYDAVLIIEAPDNVSAAACAIAVTSTGAFTSFKTMPLLTVEEGIGAMKKAAHLSYKAPK